MHRGSFGIKPYSRIIHITLSLAEKQEDSQFFNKPLTNKGSLPKRLPQRIDKPVGCGVRGDVGVPPQTPAGGLPQPQSSSRALPCPGLVSVDSYGSLCASRKCPLGTRSPPSPCTPLLGRSPKGARVWWVISALALSFHLGLRPKTPSEGLEHEQEKNVQQKGRGSQATAHSVSKKSEVSEMPAVPFPEPHSQQSRGYAPRGSRGVLGRSPKWVRKAKVECRPQTFASFGAKPQ